MYIRFVINRTDNRSHQPQGVFAAAYHLLEHGDLSADQHECLREILEWFADNLPVPKRLDMTDRATFWFYASARRHIGRMWELSNLLQSHDVFVFVQARGSLRNCVYRDAFQVAACPSPHSDPVRTR